MCVKVPILQFAAAAVSGSMGSVKRTSKPSCVIEMRSISKGVTPVQAMRSRAKGSIPRTGQPRFVPPQSSLPSFVNETSSRPVESPSRKG